MMVILMVILAIVVGMFVGFWIGVAVMTKIRAEEITRKLGVSPKTVKKRSMLLRESMSLIHQFVYPMGLDDVSILAKSHEEKARELLNRYHSEMEES